MRKRVLFLAASLQNFLVTAMIKTITNEGYEVISSNPDVVELARTPDLPDIMICWLEGDLEGFLGTLKFIKKMLTKDGHGKVLYLIGNQKEFDVAYEVIPKDFVAQTFARPVNMHDLIAKLNTIVTEEDQQKGKNRILVVDDDPTILRTLNKWFSEKYEVFMANSGMNAISFLAKNSVDLILLDYEMPVISGLQVFEMLKSEPLTASIPVIFLTAKDDKNIVMQVLSAKPAKYLLKTMPPEALIQSVDDFFMGK